MCGVVALRLAAAAPLKMCFLAALAPFGTRTPLETTPPPPHAIPPSFPSTSTIQYREALLSRCAWQGQTGAKLEPRSGGLSVHDHGGEDFVVLGGRGKWESLIRQARVLPSIGQSHPNPPPPQIPNLWGRETGREEIGGGGKRHVGVCVRMRVGVSSA